MCFEKEGEWSSLLESRNDHKSYEGIRRSLGNLGRTIFKK